MRESKHVQQGLRTNRTFLYHHIHYMYQAHRLLRLLPFFVLLRVPLVLLPTLVREFRVRKCCAVHVTTLLTKQTSSAATSRLVVLPAFLSGVASLSERVPVLWRRQKLGLQLFPSVTKSTSIAHGLYNSRFLRCRSKILWQICRQQCGGFQFYRYGDIKKLRNPPTPIRGHLILQLNHVTNFMVYTCSTRYRPTCKVILLCKYYLFIISLRIFHNINTGAEQRKMKYRLQ